MIGTLAPSGSVTFRASRVPHTFWGRLAAALPVPGLGKEVLSWRIRNLPAILLGFTKLGLSLVAARLSGLPVLYGTLYLRKRAYGEAWVDYGIASVRVVTTAGVNYIVDAFQNTTELENLKFHGFGTGVAAEATSDTALGTELTTQYAVDNTRPTGSTIEGASANIYRTVATLSPDTGGTIAVTEHGVFSATSAGTLLDRSVFSAVNLVAGSDSLQATYDLTFTAGS